MFNIVDAWIHSSMAVRQRDKKQEIVQKITLPKDKYGELDRTEIELLDGYGFIIKKEGEDYE